MKYQYIFGPVRSGRLGLSLGVDMLGRRACSMDCVYCEVGPTLDLTLEQTVYAPADAILSELARWKKEHAASPDIVTLGGLGEPCLNTELDAVLVGARKLFPGVPTAVLTNSTLLHDPAVRRRLNLADVVLPSMDTLVEAEFKRLNRPHSDVSLADCADGLATFRKAFSGRLYLETLLVQGFNDSAENSALLTTYLGELSPDRIDVVTVTRPGTLPEARPVDDETLKAWRGALAAAGKQASDRSLHRRPRNACCKRPAHKREAMEFSPDTVSEAVARSAGRRPQTQAELAASLGVSEEAVHAALDRFMKQGLITTHRIDDETFFQYRDSSVDHTEEVVA